MSTDAEEFDPQRILQTLQRHGVEFVIVGGFGSQIHGADRQTFDIDLVPSSAPQNDERLAAALREMNARLRVAGMTDEEARQLPVVIDTATIRAFGSTTWNTDAGPLDVLRDLPVHGDNRPYDDLVMRSEDYSLSGVVVSTPPTTPSPTSADGRRQSRGPIRLPLSAPPASAPARLPLGFSTTSPPPIRRVTSRAPG